MKILRKLRNYYFYCGIEKDEYNALKKDAYVSNFIVWRVLHFMMAIIFGFLFIGSLFNDLMMANRLFYFALFLYSVIAIAAFFILKKDSLIAQFLIYLSMTMLFLFACFITQNKPDIPATTFIALLIITPMFMIDKPFFMTIELCAASAIFVAWMYRVKPYEVWRYDLYNVVLYTIIGIFLNIIANSIRIREFVLTRQINIQKDTDELTGLRNKAALTREINAFLADDKSDKGIMFILDVDRFKSINDNYGHDVGDQVIRQLGKYLGSISSDKEITGRFGGDEFVIFLKDTNDKETARKMAEKIIEEVSEKVTLPNKEEKVAVSIGAAIYDGKEKNYSEIFNRADSAMYKAKGDPDYRYFLYE